MNLCVAIGLADLVFVAGMQGYTSNSDTGCKVSRKESIALVLMIFFFFLHKSMNALYWSIQAVNKMYILTD